MSRQSMHDKLKQTTEAQQQDNCDRFANADSVLLKGVAGKQDGQPKPEDDKPKLIRDGFLIPEQEHAIIQATRQRLAGNGITASKTEVIRLALKALEKQSDKQLLTLYRSLDTIRKGRPSD
jgi:hypothetical protein